MRKRRSLTNIILLAIEKSIDGYIRLEDFTNNTYKYTTGYDRILKKNSLAQSIKRLREKGLIDFINQEKLIVKLTDKGLEKAVFEKLKEKNQKNWDGYFTLVSFDIPEKRKQARNLLRLRLKEWGFLMWQKSLWATRKNCADPLESYIKKLGIQSWVKVFRSKNIDL